MTEEQLELFKDFDYGNKPPIMSDRQMIEHLLTHAHWTTTQPWLQIAMRLAELSENQK